MNDREKIRVIEYHWQAEAVAFREAGRIARTSFLTAERLQAMEARQESLEKANRLMDAALDIQNGVFEH